MEGLDIITGLSHEFGTPDFVKGGGGNTSVKNEDTLWVKPSGTTLSGLSPTGFVAMDRKKISALYQAATPEEADAREVLVKELMAAAVLPDSSGRPSVEAPLHDSFEARFVVHTHAVLVNGMTCAVDGKATCERLFPDALWIEYIDPGYTLCMHVRQELNTYKEAHGKQPAVVILKNHGIFVAAETADGIREAYSQVMGTLEAEYTKAGIDTNLRYGATPSEADISTTSTAIKNALGEQDGAAVSYSAAYEIAPEPISPDHMVYSKSYPLLGEISVDSVAAFRDKHGYSPRVFPCEHGIFAAGTSQKNADLALVLSQDGAQIKQLAEAFGGIEYMTNDARDFIDNWEVEAYRAKLMSDMNK